MIDRDAFNNDIFVLCSPVHVIDDVECFVAHLMRRLPGTASTDRADIFMPGHEMLNLIGFNDKEAPLLHAYVDDNLELLWELARNTAGGAPDE